MKDEGRKKAVIERVFSSPGVYAWGVGAAIEISSPFRGFG
jgi:hypothetical protein